MVNSRPRAPGAADAPSLRLFLLLLAILLSVAFVRPIDHDEGQYVVAVALMRSGLPYRDFAYLQTPLQPLLFAPLAWLCEGWLFPALRAANALCAAGAAVLLHMAVRHAGGSPRSAAVATLALASSHAFLFAGTVARNDALPLLLHMAGLALVLDALRTGGQPLRFLLAGLMLGAAASAKISYGLPAAAVGLWALLHLRAIGWPCLCALAAGGLAGGLPTLVLWAIAPDAAWFGIIDYSLHAPREWQTLNQRSFMIETPLSLVRLLRFLAQGSALIALCAIAAAARHRPGPSHVSQRLLDCMILAALIAAWLPRPIYVQYLLPLLPALFLRFAAILDDPRWRRPLATGALALFMTAGVAETLVAIAPGIADTKSPLLSAVGDARAVGRAVRASGATGPIVTLAPERVIDSGVSLDPRFATGPFLFRTRDLLTPAERSAFHVVNRANLAEALTRHPPAAIVTGPESAITPAAPQGLDAPLRTFAVAHGYRATPLPSGEGTLFVREQRAKAALQRHR
ncbi:phospholipid carrier-dependent glycosyltransferase [Sphingobium algorifonticola]|uniref:Phospholipid carrier-dependent glycosyltransferase n=1 Tax=Sphingobium algorifonticola TaxID=2008318 RepID=A0A437JDH5_9SPHN|nr:phospholipid carrier-dependent glycosyltransferase [Sphingobium algorifonticola]RVT43672.1 phospholipid carrier-dependent glycosyltransferase [Sphingobium algorifonticola]